MSQCTELPIEIKELLELLLCLPAKRFSEVLKECQEYAALFQPTVYDGGPKGEALVKGLLLAIEAKKKCALNV